MIVGVGHHPRFLLDAIRTLRHHNLFVFPEFYDNLKKLTSHANGKFDYALELSRKKNDIIIATWPDYYYLTMLPENIVYVFPLHKKEEVGFVLSKLDSKYEYFLGFPNRDHFRDYDLQWFADFARRHGIKTWLLGLKPRWFRYLWVFDACDVTTMSLKGKGFADMKKPSIMQTYLDFITRLLEDRIPRPLNLVGV